MYNLDECPDRYALIAWAMGIERGGMSAAEAGRAAADAIWEMTRKMGVPQRLRDVGVPEDGLLEAAEISLGDSSIVYNPKPMFEPEDVVEVYRMTW